MIKRILKVIDEMLTRECLLCGDFMLDILSSSTVADQEPKSLSSISMVGGGPGAGKPNQTIMNQYMLDMDTLEDMI